MANKVKTKKAAKRKSHNVKARQKSKSGSKGKAKGVKPGKVFIYALALAALGGGGFLVYDKLKKKRQAAQDEIPNNASDTIIINNSLPVSYSNSGSRLISSGSSASDNFPLKRGSRGARVSILQQALKKTTPSIAVDGQFGPKTAAALKSAGYPEVVDESAFNKITGGSAMTIVFNPASIATALYKSAQANDLTGVLMALKQIKSVSDYTSVNERYKKQAFISKTIVTDLLEYTFKMDEPAKAQIKNEFLRMGLKVDSSGTWSLQGIRLYKDLITIRATIVTDSRNNRIPVRKNTILGDEIEVSNGITWFKSIDNSILKVPTQDVKYT